MAEHSRALDATRARVTADLAAREKALAHCEAGAADAAGRGEAERRKRRAQDEQARMPRLTTQNCSDHSPLDRIPASSYGMCFDRSFYASVQSKTVLP